MYTLELEVESGKIYKYVSITTPKIGMWAALTGNILLDGGTVLKITKGIDEDCYVWLNGDLVTSKQREESEMESNKRAKESIGDRVLAACQLLESVGINFKSRRDIPCTSRTLILSTDKWEVDLESVNLAVNDCKDLAEVKLKYVRSEISGYGVINEKLERRLGIISGSL